MPSIAPSANAPSSSTNGSTCASDQPPFRHGSAGKSVDGRSRAPEAARPQGGERQRSAGRRPTYRHQTGQGWRACYMCRKCPRPGCRRVRARELRAIDALGLRFPSPELVAALRRCSSGRRRGLLARSVVVSNRNPGGSASSSALVSCDSGGPIPSGPRKPPNGQSVITNVTLTTRNFISEMTSNFLPGTVIGPSCL